MGLKIEWDRVSGHAGVPGNERCDEIATGFADKDLPSLYDGSAKAYTIDLSVRESAAGSAEKKKKSSSSAKAYSYLSSSAESSRFTRPGPNVRRGSKA
jgi:ribonuclease HI